MLIAESNLRKIVREMLLEADAVDQKKSEMQAVSNTTAAYGASSDVAERAADRISAGKLDQFKMFISDILAGKIIVTKSKNTPDNNLFVRAFLDYYYRAYEPKTGTSATAAAAGLKAPSGKTPGVSGSDVFRSRSASFGQGTVASMNEAADDKTLTTVGLGTSYPDAAIKYVQQKLGLQVDGDFGRQTMAALATGGKIKLTPTSIERIKANKQLRDLLALTTSRAILDDDFTKVEAALAKVVGADPQAAAPAAALKKSSVSGALPDAPSPGVATLAPPPAVSTGPGANVTVKRPPAGYNP